MLIISRNVIARSLAAARRSGDVASFPILAVDGGDGFVSSDLSNHQQIHQTKAQGGLVISSSSVKNPPEMPADIDVLVHANQKNVSVNKLENPDDFQFTAWVRNSEGTERRKVEVVELDHQIFSRIRGLYETEVLRTKRVLIIGLGSGGSSIALELAKAGVGNFLLVDHQHLEVPNVVRHVCGLADLARYKTKAVRDQILNKNPSAVVETFEKECDWGWLTELHELVERSDIVFCCTDNRPSRVLVNLASVSLSKVCIYGGTFNRAYGGHVLRVIPRQSMCYQCFIDLLPEKAEDQEIASEEQASLIAYDDRDVAIEPGLANDIAPMSTMCVKLGVLEMLRGTPTTLVSLYEDLSNAWYQWLNRRENDTEYAELSPLDSGGEEGPRILAWYGIANERNPGCPACGDFIGQSSRPSTPSREHMDAFAPTTRQS